jgi:hypothetical protein
MKSTSGHAIKVGCIAFLLACAGHRVAGIPHGGVGSLVVLVADSAGVPRIANAYFAEDPRVTTDVVMWGHAGVWADEEGVAHLGGWRPGKYTLVVRTLGYYQERRSVVLIAGRVDTVRIALRPMDMTTQ